MTVCQMTVCLMTVCQMTICLMTVCQMIVCLMTTGLMTAGSYNLAMQVTNHTAGSDKQQLISRQSIRGNKDEKLHIIQQKLIKRHYFALVSDSKMIQCYKIQANIASARVQFFVNSLLIFNNFQDHIMRSNRSHARILPA